MEADSGSAGTQMGPSQLCVRAGRNRRTQASTRKFAETPYPNKKRPVRPTSFCLLQFNLDRFTFLRMNSFGVVLLQSSSLYRACNIVY